MVFNGYKIEFLINIYINMLKYIFNILQHKYIYTFI
jgi:hypothetical protein